MFLIRRRQRQGFRSSENQGVYFLNDCFQNDSNAVFGVFLQRLQLLF